MVRGLEEFGCLVDVLDPWADPAEVKEVYGVKTVSELDSLNAGRYDAVVLAVAHREFAGFDVRKFGSENVAVYDIKGILPRDVVDERL